MAAFYLQETQRLLSEPGTDFFFASQIWVSYNVIFTETMRGENVASTDQLHRKLSLLYQAQEIN
jgi:hypothetical protein